MTARRILPTWLYAELHKQRRLGPKRYVQYTWLEQRQRRKPPPRAGAPFDICAPVPIMLHDSTVHGVRSHWVTSGQGIRELRAFRRIAPGHSMFLDIGAGAGIFSAAFCALTGNQACAFEPSPTMFGRLTALIDLNPSFKIAPFNLALGAVSGTQPVSSYADSQFRGIHEDERATETMFCRNT